MKFFSILSFICCISLVSVSFQVQAQNDKDVVPYSDIKWGHLNPARGDKSPSAGQLWGNRTTSDASGFLVQFMDGFSSPPHIHNVTYRGVVIRGLVHNDDPKAENMWLPAGSFWTQPAGESHITAARGEQNIAYIEIDSGPYLVQPADQAFDNGERPINVDQSNLVWLDASDVTWIEQVDGVQLAFLWGHTKVDELGGHFVKLPNGFSGFIKSQNSELRAVVVQGQLSLHDLTLEAGSYFGSSQALEHRISVEGGAVLYVRSRGKFVVHSPPRLQP